MELHFCELYLPIAKHPTMFLHPELFTGFFESFSRSWGLPTFVSVPKNPVIHSACIRSFWSIDVIFVANNLWRSILYNFFSFCQQLQHLLRNEFYFKRIICLKYMGELKSVNLDLKKLCEPKNPMIKIYLPYQGTLLQHSPILEDHFWDCTRKLLDFFLNEFS